MGSFIWGELLVLLLATQLAWGQLKAVVDDSGLVNAELLQASLAEAQAIYINSNGTDIPQVLLPPGVITLANPLTISTPMALVGSNISASVLDCGAGSFPNASAALLVHSGGVMLAGLVLRNCQNGSLIVDPWRFNSTAAPAPVDTTVWVRDCKFEDNLMPIFGGAAISSYDAILAISNSSFTRNARRDGQLLYMLPPSASISGVSRSLPPRAHILSALGGTITLAGCSFSDNGPDPTLLGVVSEVPTENIQAFNGVELSPVLACMSAGISLTYNTTYTRTSVTPSLTVTSSLFHNNIVTCGNFYSVVQATNRTALEPGHGLRLTVSDTAMTRVSGNAVGMTCASSLQQRNAVAACRLVVRNATISHVGVDDLWVLQTDSSSAFQASRAVFAEQVV